MLGVKVTLSLAGDVMIAVIEERLEAIRALCREYGVARLEVFGSACTGEFVPERSDVDFLIEYEAGTSLGPWMGRFFELEERLEALLGYPVDLVMVGAGALQNRWFVREAEKTRTVIFDRS